MSATDAFELAAIFGSIVGAWFALIGWKLVAANRAQGDARLRPDE